MKKKFTIGLILTVMILVSTGFMTPYLIGNLSIQGIRTLENLTLSSKAINYGWSHQGKPVCTASSEQKDPKIVSDGNGGAIIVWEDFRNSATTGWDIYAQKVDSSGVSQWSANGLAICTENDFQIDPAICTDGAGGAIITWSDARGASYDIYAQWVTSDGTRMWGDNGTLICNEIGGQTNPRIVYNGTTAAIICWEDQRVGGEIDIYAQKINAGGVTEWTNNGTALCNAIGFQYGPEICSDDAGSAIVVWRDERDDSNGDIYTQGIDGDSSLKWAANGSHIANGSAVQRNPVISKDGTGGAIIAWEDNNTGNFDIYVQRMHPSGAVMWGVNGSPMCNALGNQYNPAIITSGSFSSTGFAIVNWEDNRGADTDIYAQKVNNSDYVWTSNGRQICDATGNQLTPVLCYDGAGGAIMSWLDYRSGTSHIYVQWVDINGASKWTAGGAPVCTAAGGQYILEICGNDSSQAVLTWKDQRSLPDTGQIYAQKVMDGPPGMALSTIFLIIAILIKMNVDIGVIIVIYIVLSRQIIEP